MTSIEKKLSEIYRDTLVQMEQYSLRYLDVRTQFSCLCNGQLVYQSEALNRDQIEAELPERCRSSRATGLELVTTGINSKGEYVHLSEESYRLSRVSKRGIGNTAQGLGAPVAYNTPAAPGYPTHVPMSGYAGLSGLEINALVDKNVKEKVLELEHERLQDAMERLRKINKKLKKANKELESATDANDKTAKYIELAQSFAPALGGLLGLNMSAPVKEEDESLGGLAGNSIAESIVAIVPGFISRLSPAQQEELLTIVQGINRVPELIAPIARFVRQSYTKAGTSEQRGNTTQQRAGTQQPEQQATAKPKTTQEEVAHDGM